MAQSQAPKGENDYSTPPAPKCIGKERFLLPQDPQMGSQDYRLEQPRKTLAYAKALQYWVERVKPLIPGEPCQLVGCVLELRLAMEAFTTFQDSKVLGNDITPWGHSLWACPRGSFSMAYSRQQPGSSIGSTTQTSMLPLGETLLPHAAPTAQPSSCPPENAREPLPVTSLLMPPGEAKEDVKAKEVEGAEEVTAQVPPGWTQVHPSRPVVHVGLVPHSLAD